MIQITGTATGKRYFFPFDMISSMTEGEFEGKDGTIIYMKEEFKGVNDLKVYHAEETPEEILLMEFGEW